VQRGWHRLGWFANRTVPLGTEGTLKREASACVRGDGDVGLVIRLLGPVAVEVDGEPVRLSSVKQKAILAQLALRGGQITQLAELVAGLWGENPPATATNTIQVHVSALRRALGRAGNLIQNRPPGYRLEGGDVDVLRFEQLAEEARQGQPDKWRDALEQWTGEAALADLADVPFAPAVATRLDELRLTATEELIERELALGRHLKYVAELTKLTRKHPYRETFWRQLMLGLYRSDRQSDALAAFREAARVLAEDLGIDPGPALAAMHQAILTQDPALAGPAPRFDLPRLPGELVGRDVELDRLLELVRTARLVTLTGPGGVGKTRLALEVAHRLRAEFVPLADVHSAEAAAARITGSGGTLLILDNLEQIPDADALVLDLLDSTERNVLVTSRSALHLRAETVVVLAPLASTYAAELFTSEAHRAGAAATLDQSSVNAICQRLDGLPLALVLAAARCRLLTPAQMLSRLERGGLGDGPKDLPDRQRTLAATVQWSVELLDPPARDLFADLAVFAAPFTVEAAEEVSNPDTLGALVDASLLIAHEGRLNMLETIRDCARDVLAASGRDTRERHARWVLRQVAELAPRLNTATEDAALSGLGALLPEIRAATEYLSRTDADAAASMLVRTRRVWFVQGLMDEIRERLDRVAPLVAASRTKVEVTALQANFAKIVGSPEGRSLLEQVLPALRETAGVAEMLTNTLCHLAALESEAGERAAAEAHAAEAVEVARGLGGAMLQMALDLSSYVARTIGDVDRAIEVARQAVEAGRTAPSLQLANALGTLAWALSDAGRLDEAADAGLEALARSRSEFPAVRGEIATEVAASLGKNSPPAVISALGEAITFTVAVGVWPLAAQATCALAVIVAGTHDTAAAQLIAAVSRHIDDPRFADLSAGLRQRLGADAWLEASRIGLTLNADNLARVVQDCTGFTGS
jgi:DNA-binding SARP family transcriptional activator/predicted ATPase